MSKHEVKTNWAGGMAFDSHIGNHIIRMDSGDYATGPTPKPLLLSALSGCTGIDVVSTLEKMRVTFSDLSIDVNGQLSETTPKVYTDIEVIYTIKVSEADKPKMERAVQLSVEKYCGVSFMLEKAANLTHRIIYL